jgi:hypothetical protein
VKRDGKAAFWCLGTGAGLILACVLSKGLYLIGTLGNPVSIYGAAAFIRLEPQEFSFFGAELGMVLGFLLAARVTGRDRGTALDAIALPGTLLVAALRFATLYLGETGLGEFQTLGIYDLTDGVFPAFFSAGGPGLLGRLVDGRRDAGNAGRAALRRLRGCEEKAAGRRSRPAV